jgi:hypothetical protein
VTGNGWDWLGTAVPLLSLEIGQQSRGDVVVAQLVGHFAEQVGQGKLCFSGVGQSDGSELWGGLHLVHNAAPTSGIHARRIGRG